MCHDRERLIGYLYDECDPAERASIEAHLAGCAECREETGALRSVRHDLLAWDVPEQGSVWRPFAPVRVKPSWRDVPSWVIAAAAAAVFMVGAAGGVVSRTWWPVAAPVTADAAVASTDAPASLTLSATEVDQIEQRVLDRVRLEMADRVEALAAQQLRRGPAVSRANVATADPRELLGRIHELERFQDRQIYLNSLVDQELNGLVNQTSRGRSLLQQAAFEPGR
jgi:anti-sigma factor RsiW